MDSNAYALEMLVLVRLGEARAHAHRLSLIALARRRRGPLRVRLGLRLIAAGRWLCGGRVLAPVRSS